MSLADVFRDADVARAYRERAPYPTETFAILEELIVEPRTVLDAEPPYGLITAGSSLHWMDLGRVMPRFAAALAPGGRLALLETDDGEHPLPEMLQIIERYSELSHHQDLADTVKGIRVATGCRHGSDAALAASGSFVQEGEERTAPVSLRRSLEEYLEFLHSTSTLARVRLGDRADRFDADVRDLFSRNGMTSIEHAVIGVVVWGRPA